MSKKSKAQLKAEALKLKAKTETPVEAVQEEKPVEAVQEETFGQYQKFFPHQNLAMLV